jgi:cytochrome d ubiquinol oxidase subunit II
MFTFESFLNLPLIWAGIIGLAIFVYVCLDGFDLGVGILFPFAPSEECRRRMLNSIAPFWDGNETWLILGGGGLFAAFPLAYAILLPAFYIPVLTMLIALVFRGVAFEFHYKSSDRARFFWDYAFHFGSLAAAFSQGVMLGAFVQGVAVDGRVFAGGPFSWATPFALMTGVALVWGYALLGSTWLIMKTDENTQAWARKISSYVLLYVILFMITVSLWVPFLKNDIYLRWFSWPNLGYLLPIPVATFILCLMLIQSVRSTREIRPFLLTLALFALNYIGLMISIYPWIVPYKVHFSEAAAVGPSLSLMLVGVVITLPVILAYTGYNYYIFRGKSSHEDVY